MTTVILLSGSPPYVRAQNAPPAVSLLIRTDDVGMSHSVNMGVQRLLETGLPVSVSVTDSPLPEMSANRQGELDALTAPRFAAALNARNVELLTYRTLIARHGLQSMRHPSTEAPEGSK
ncbi:MAG: hypothetical protein ACREMN_00920 [Gemmatimonadales bacterium]